MRKQGQSEPIIWEELSWSEVRDLVDGGVKSVIWPIGATEAHGYHLPLLTDTLCVDVVAKRVSARLGIPTLPVQPIGVSLGHGKFPGTLSIRPTTLIAMVCDVAESLHAAGIRQILLLNGHMWNEATLMAAREEIRARFDDVQIRAVSYWAFADTSEYDDCPNAPDMLHAEFKETSWVLDLRPELVDMSQAVDEEDFPQFWDYRMDQVSRSGVMGNKTTEANPEAGRDLIERTVDGIVEALARGLEETIPIPDWSPGVEVLSGGRDAG
jgi:creatinine amidohydrolase